MPVIVAGAGAHANHATMDVGERQVLIHMEGEPQTYWQHLLVHRLEGSRWITVDPQLTVSAEDLLGEEIIPLVRASAFPLAGRPFLCFDVLTDAALLGLRTRALALAEVHGMAPLLAPTPCPSAWLHSDPSLP